MLKYMSVYMKVVMNPKCPELIQFPKSDLLDLIKPWSIYLSSTFLWFSEALLISKLHNKDDFLFKLKLAVT